MNLNLKKFDIKSIKSDKVCVFRKRETGKSFLVKDLLYSSSFAQARLYQAPKEPTNSTDSGSRGIHPR